MENLQAIKPSPKTATKENIIGAEALMRSLVMEGVEIIFGYPGGAIMPIYDELYKYRDKLKHILTRHEQGATHCAQGYARTSGKPGVVFATSGPGATNLITGLADALIDSTPIVCITGQVPFPLLGTDAFQETDVIGISMPITKWNTQVTKASELAKSISKAFYIAKSGRPGPVLIDITKNAQFEEFDFEYSFCTGIRSYKPVPVSTEESLEEAAAIINQAKKPYILFGQGIVLGNAERELKEFIEKSGIPSAWTILGLSALPTNHPLNVGMLGMHGNYAPNVLTNEADVIIAIGMRFDDRVTGRLDKYVPNAKVIHFEIDPSEINKNVHADVAILGDAKDSLKRILPLIEKRTHHKWRNQFKELSKLEKKKIIDRDLSPNKEKITMGEVIHQINKQTNGDSIIVTDVGQHQMVACRYTHFTQSKSNITSGGLGTMGFALPAAIGAKMGAPERQVIAIIGDGGFQMTIQELGTIFQNQTAIKILILNNDYLGMVRQWQELFFDSRYSATEMVNPNFVKITEGYGIKAKMVSDRSELEASIKEMLDFSGPYLLEVKVEKEGNVFPMVPSGASVSEIRLS